MLTFMKRHNLLDTTTKSLEMAKKSVWAKIIAYNCVQVIDFFVLFAIWMSTLHTGSLRYASRNFRTHSPLLFRVKVFGPKMSVTTTDKIIIKIRLYSLPCSVNGMRFPLKLHMKWKRIADRVLRLVLL